MNITNAVLFGNYHSYNDFHLILSQKTIGTPSPKTETIDIPGGDGVLDLTEFFGEVKYNNRPLTFEFSTIIPPEQFMPLFKIVQNALHGKKMPIILTEDPEWYYFGRISVSEWKADRNIGKLTIDCDCEPFKYKLSNTVISKAVSGTESIVLTNSRKRAVPEVKIESESGIQIVYRDSNIWDLGSGTYILPELELVEGENTVTVTGTGTITFTWLEGSL